MREILFRGFHKDENGKQKAFVNGEWIKGEWVEGYYVNYGYAGKEKDYIIPVYASDLYVIEVIPETVGQYIGFTDENGIKIFEGDIIAMQLNCAGISKSVIEYECGAFVRNIGEQRKYRFEGGSHSYIIGNIHDNPELLEGVGNEVNNNESN